MQDADFMEVFIVNTFADTYHPTVLDLSNRTNAVVISVDDVLVVYCYTNTLLFLFLCLYSFVCRCSQMP